MKKLMEYRGIFLAAVSGLTYAVSAILVKWLNNVSSSDKAFVMCLGSAFLTWPAIICSQNSKLDRNSFLFISLASVCYAVSEVTRFQSLIMLPVGDASAIHFNSPIVIAVLARIFLKEKLDRVTAISMGLSFVGVCLVVQLPVRIEEAVEGKTNSYGTLQHVIGSFYALAGLLSAAFNAIILRKLRQVNVWMLTGVRSLLCCVWVAALSPAFGSRLLSTIQGECSYESWLVLLLALVFFLSAFLYFLALKYEKASVVSVILMSVYTFMGYVCQVLIFGDQLNPYSCSGALVVLLAGVLTIFRKKI